MRSGNIYFDHNSTTPVLEEVLDKVLPLIRDAANPSSVHKTGRVSKGLVEDARKEIMSFMGIDALSHDVIFTSCGTEANNTVIKGIFADHVFISATEHASVLNPASHKKNTVILRVDKDGLVDLDSLKNVLRSSNGKKLVSISHANNETGVIQDLKSISKIVHEESAILHSDMVQSFGRIDCDIKDLGVDIATISSHKIGGMHGAAAIVKRSEIALEPLLVGGGQERGYRSGTENTYAIVAFGEAVSQLKNNIKKYSDVRKLRDSLEDDILKFEPNARIYSKECNRLPNTSYIAMPGVGFHTQLMNFDLKGFSVSAGSACSSGALDNSHVLEAMDKDSDMNASAVRVSLGLSNNEGEVKAFVNAWKDLYNSFAQKQKMRDKSRKSEVTHG